MCDVCGMCYAYACVYVYVLMCGVCDVCCVFVVCVVCNVSVLHAICVCAYMFIYLYV